MTYDNTNKGVLFINDRKEQDSHPDRKGSINIEGVEYWLSAWDKNTSKGETISLTVKRKDAKPAEPSGAEYSKAQNEPSGFDNDFDSEVPF